MVPDLAIFDFFLDFYFQTFVFFCQSQILQRKIFHRLGSTRKLFMQEHFIWVTPAKNVGSISREKICGRVIRLLTLRTDPGVVLIAQGFVSNRF